MLTREDALNLLEEKGVTGALLFHSLASEAVLQALARHLGRDVNLWGLTGLLHDLDYARTAENPAQHGIIAADELSGKLPQEALQCIRAHNAELNGTTPESEFDYALRCGESVTGLIHAAALMRPTRYDGMTVKSIKKKLKDKAFAANVSRENIRQCDRLGLELDDFLALAIGAMALLDNSLSNA